MTVIINTPMVSEQVREVTQNNKANNQNDLEIKELLNNAIAQVDSDKKHNVNWLNNQSVELQNIPANALHHFVLEAEKLGKSVSFEKKTIVTIA